MGIIFGGEVKSRMDTRTKQAGGGRWWPLRETGDNWGQALGWLLGVMEAGEEGQSEVFSGRGKKKGWEKKPFLLCEMQSFEPSWGQD